MALYISDSNLGELFHIGVDEENLRMAVQEEIIDDEDVNVVTSKEDWDAFCYGNQWTIYTEIKPVSVNELIA